MKKQLAKGKNNRNISQKKRFILFTLGEYYSEANKKLKEKDLLVSISKSVFIDLLMKTKIISKKERALYKDLEDLEATRLISYTNRVLKLTTKGKKEYNKIRKEIIPYLNLAKILNAAELYRLAKKSQTFFKR